MQFYKILYKPADRDSNNNNNNDNVHKISEDLHFKNAQKATAAKENGGKFVVGVGKYCICGPRCWC